MNLGFSGWVIERRSRSRAAREMDKKNNESAEDGQDDEQQHQHARQHALRQFRIAAKADGARLGRGRNGEQAQRPKPDKFSKRFHR